MTNAERAQLEFAAKTSAPLRKLLDEYDRIRPIYEAAKQVRLQRFSIRSTLTAADRKSFDVFNEIVDRATTKESIDG